MSRTLASVSMALLVLTVSMGLKTAAVSHSGSDFVMVHGLAPAPVQSQLNGPDPTPAPWKRSPLRLNGPDPTPAPWKR
jgi:hypothetical protein